MYEFRDKMALKDNIISMSYAIQYKHVIECNKSILKLIFKNLGYEIKNDKSKNFDLHLLKNNNEIFIIQHHRNKYQNDENLEKEVSLALKEILKVKNDNHKELIIYFEKESIDILRDDERKYDINSDFVKNLKNKLMREANISFELLYLKNFFKKFNIENMVETLENYEQKYFDDPSHQVEIQDLISPETIDGLSIKEKDKLLNDKKFKFINCYIKKED